MGMHAYEVRPRKDKRGVDLISEALPFGRLWYGGQVPIVSRAAKCVRFVLDLNPRFFLRSI